MFIKSILNVLLFVLLFVASGYAKTITIEPIGNNSDDTSHIQNAINNLYSGDSLLLLDGIYLISSRLTLTESNVTITFSNGAQLKVMGNDGVVEAFHCSGNDVIFNNFYLDGSNKCAIGLQLYNCNNITLNGPTIVNIDGSYFSPVRAGDGIRVRTSSYVTIDNALIKNITSTTKAAAGIHSISISNSSKSYKTIVTDAHIENVKAITDSDGIKFVIDKYINGETIDTYCEVKGSSFYNCHKRAIKIQTRHNTIDRVEIISDLTCMDTISHYLVDFQHADYSSLKNSTISVAGKYLGAIGIWGNNITVDNIDIYQSSKTTEFKDTTTGKAPYRTYAIRKDGKTYCENSVISNVNIYGNYTSAVYFIGGTGVAKNITLKNIYSRDSIKIAPELNDIAIRNCSFGNYDYSGTLTNCLITENEPVAHYKMDESVGIVYDTSANKNDASATNVLTYGARGAIHNAISFNGTDSYVQVSNSPSLQNLNHHITIAAWIHPDVNSDCSIVNKKWDSQCSGFEFGTYYSGRLRFQFGDGTNTQVIDSVNNVYQTGQWQHVAAVYDSKKVKFYVDGELKDSCSVIGRIVANTLPIYMGKYQGSARYFSGKLDDIRIYNRSLTEYQIKEAAYMSAYYKLEQNGNDETGYNNCTSPHTPGDAEGKVKNAFDFEKGSYLMAADHDTLDLGKNISISAWIKPSSLPWGATIVNKKFDSKSNGYELRSHYKKLKFIINSTVFITTQDLLDTGEFQHITVTYDGNDANFYINSIHKETISAAIETIPVTNTYPLFIGIYQNKNSYPFDGIIDEIKLYKCKLEQDGVTEAFNEGWEQYNQQR